MRVFQLLAVAGCAGVLAGCHRAAPPVPVAAVSAPVSPAAAQPAPDAVQVHYIDVLKVTDALRQSEDLAMHTPIDGESAQRIRDARAILDTAAADFEKADHPPQSQAMDQKVRGGLRHEDAFFDDALRVLASQTPSEHQSRQDAALAEQAASHTLFESVVEEIHRQSQQ